MADQPDPLVTFLIEGAAERALPNLQERLADFLALTCQSGVNRLPAIPDACVFEALASAPAQRLPAWR